ncbi:MAG TPA: ERF family protein [Pseudogracilibacillus sp.]|nr:ERF family protein [Pseudogracilibacillus sp.]
MKKSESITEISKALAKFHSEVKQPARSAKNPFLKNKYVPLEELVESINDVAPEHGLSFVQWALNDEHGRIGVATMLMHESGEFIEFDPIFMNAEKDTPQGAGSLITYLKRYSLSAVFGMTSELDDDGNGSSGTDNKTNRRNNEKLISQKQVGDLKTKALEFANMRGQQQQDVFKALNIQDITRLTSQQANKCIKTIEGWIKKASESK